jgi:photosystem II stability/assembly factor-like uncharacterized protein
MRIARPLRPLFLLSSLSLVPSLVGCGLIDRLRGGGDEADASEDGDEADASEATEGSDKPADPGAGEVAAAARAKPAVTGLDRFKHWVPEHAFLNSPTVVADVISETELIVATRDAHIGVSVDAGETWEWSKANDAVRDVTGYPGGPYVALHEGALSLSDDGVVWRRLPRYGGDSLIDVVAAEIGLVAIGNNGSFVHLGKDGSPIGPAHAGLLPDKFKPKTITELNGAVLAWSGKRGYGTTDGATWTELEAIPVMPDFKTYLTSAGSCTLAKVGKGKGVVCSVSGTAHGLGDEFAVDNKGTVSLTADGGETWKSSRLPFKGANTIFGATGGPYYALGNGGAVAISKDGGQTWVDQKWEESANLVDGVVDGQTIVIVGAKGTIIYSTNGGSKWDYAQPPVGQNLSWVGKVSGQFVASDGRNFIASQTGADWVETDPVELPGKLGDCTSNGPEDNASCRWSASVSTPDGLPEVRGLTFDGDVGLALGDNALVAVTRDGGATWVSANSLGLGRNGGTALAVRGDKVLATDGARLVSTVDAGASWIEGQMVRKYSINAVHISASGILYAAARDEILAAKVDPKLWLPAANESLKGDWRWIFEISGAVYVAGTKGQLLRSEDGSAWTAIETGTSNPVIAMAGEGDEVWAVTSYSRKANNLLLRSEDGGRHFILVGESPSTTDAPDLGFADGAVAWADLVSRDDGETWRRETERYFPGLVDVADGSGMLITNLVYRYGPDRLYVVTGEGERDWVRIDSAFNEGGAIQCDSTSGCWMLAAGVLYRPIGR